MRKPALKLFAVIMVATIVAAVAASAQETTDPDDLHDRLDSARAELESIQSRAGTVQEHIDSIDDQIAVVEEGLAASGALVQRTQAEIGVLQTGIKRKQELYDRVKGRAVDIAVSMYKAGPTANFEALLEAESLDELSSAIEYSSEVTKDHSRVMVAAQRLETELRAETAELEVKLAEAIEVRTEQERLAQNLAELKRAEASKLADLRDQIEGVQREVSAIQTRSAQITAQLAADAPSAGAPPGVANLSSGSSGFAWPISGAITSGYGERWGRMHTGIDIDCVTGAPIRASKAGTVVSASYDSSGYGYHVIIDHGGGFASLYAHASELYVSGGSVQQGETIAACGSTGASTGDHLHFEIRVNGSPQDPMAYLP